MMSMGVANNGAMMGAINKIVLTGLLISGAVFSIAVGFSGINTFVFLVALFLGYILVIYSIIAFFWVGVLYAIRRKSNFFKTLYPLNALIALIGCLIVMLW